MHSRREFYQKTPLVWSVRHESKVMRGLIKPGSRVLDYGCGGGSLGFIGRDEKNDITVDGFDPSIYNKNAKYHSLDDIKDVYDYIILSNILEHCPLEEVSQILTWCRAHTKNIIVMLPSTNYLFTQFHGDMTHLRPYDSFDFMYFTERHGFKVDKMVWANIGLSKHPYKLFAAINRTIFSLMVYKLPFLDFGFIASASDVRDPMEMYEEIGKKQ